MSTSNISAQKVLIGFFRKALELNSTEIEIEYKDGYEEIFAYHNNFGAGIGNLKSDSEEAEMLRSFLYEVKKTTTIMDSAEKFQFSVKIQEDFGEDTFHIRFKKGSVNKKPTKRQIDFLAFIHYYTRIHGRAPAEHEIADFFKLSPPSVHQMILTLDKNGFISRIPGQARTIKITLTDDELREIKRSADF